MMTRTAPQRAIDFYVARLHGFVLVDGPNGKVLVPPGLAGTLTFRTDVELMSFVPHFTGDWSSGGPIIGKHDPDFLDRYLRRLVERHYGPDLVDPRTIG